MGGPKVWEFKDYTPENIRVIAGRMGAERPQQATTHISDLETMLDASQHDRQAQQLAMPDQRFWEVTKRLIEAEATIAAGVYHRDEPDGTAWIRQMARDEYEGNPMNTLRKCFIEM